MLEVLTNELLILASFVAGIFIVYWLRTFDVHEKEPFSKMALVTIIGGVISIVFSLILYEYFDLLGVQDIENAFGAMFVIGPVEEGAKLITMFLLMFLIRKEMHEPADGAIYMACIALGFSLIENVFYSINSEIPWILMAIRLITATPMHIGFSVIMGLAVYFHLFHQHNWKALMGSYVCASVMHGIYDVVAFSGVAFIFILAFVWVTKNWILTILGYSAATSPLRKSLKEFVDSHNPSKHTGIECLKCGDTDDKVTYRYEKITFQKCETCDHYVTTKASLYSMSRQFGSNFKSAKKSLKTYVHRAGQQGDSSAVIRDADFISHKKKIACFDLDTMDDTFETLSRQAEKSLPKFIRGVLNN